MIARYFFAMYVVPFSGIVLIFCIFTQIFTMKRFIPLFVLLLTIQFSFGQKKLPADFCVSSQEMQLFNYINAVRKEYGKKPVKLSASLSFVAKVHVEDLFNNHPDTSICNLSSWSDKGEWTACCYNSYIPNPECMKKKPKELTPYPYYGYEMAAYFEDGYSEDSLELLWNDTKPVLDMILTRGNYEKKSWVVAGVGIYENYVSVWFGQRADKLKTPEVCGGQKIVVKDEPVLRDPSSFYIIIASFSAQADAKEALRRSRKNGFKNAGILHGGNKFRVFLGKYNSLKEAAYVKENLSPTYRDAWILKN